MDGIEVGWLETLMKKRTYEKSVVRILEFEYDKPLGPGENYISDILRVSLKAVLGSGRIVRRTIIAKKKIAQTLEFDRQYKVFDVEIRMYSIIFPLMEDLMDEYQDSNDHLWADYYGTQEDFILFEDLKSTGFRQADRRSGLDLNHALLVLKNLGRFHAMGTVLENRGSINGNEFGPLIMTRNDSISRTFCAGGVLILADTIEATWGPEWKDVADKLHSMVDSVGQKLKDLYTADCGKLKVLNHGDCWITNMLFRYELGNDYPIGHRFLDFQLSHFNSFAWDLQYFLYSSVRPDVRWAHESELIAAYHESLISTLEFYDYGRRPSENVPSREDVDAEMERLLFFGFVVASGLLPIAMADPADACDSSALTDDSVKAIQNTRMYANEKYAEYMKHDLKYFISKGLI